MRRQASREMLALYGSYVGARFDRRETAGWLPRSGDADSDSLIDLRILRGRSRDLQRNSPLAGGAVDTVVQNAVGTGMTLQPTPDLDALGWTEEQGEKYVRKLESEFGLWAESKDCDVTRTQNFYEQQGLALRSMLESGDVVTLLPFVNRPNSLSPYQTRVQLIEADRLANPKGCVDGQLLETGCRVYGGVEVDDFGGPIAYNILKRHPGSLVLGKDPWDYDRLEMFGQSSGRRSVIHLFDRKRPDQHRGIPYLSPVIELIKQLGKYTDAEIQAAVITAMFTVFVKTPLGEDSSGWTAPNTDQIASLEKTYRLESGAIIGLAQGQEIETADPKRPNTAFDGFVLAILRQIGVGLGLPFEILIKHFTASYSAARAALLEAWKVYRQRRTFLADNWCQLVFEAWMYEAVALGRINAPGFFTDPILHRAYLKSQWVGDAPGQLDPQKEAEAAMVRIDGVLSNRKIEAMELTGRNWEDVYAQAVKEQKMLNEGGLQPSVPSPVGTPTIPTQTAPADGGSDEDKPEDAQ